eukprot:578030_1
MEDKHATKTKKIWPQENVDTSFLQNEVQHKIKLKESKQKVQPKPMPHSYVKDYEQKSNLEKKKAEDPKQKLKQHDANDNISNFTTVKTKHQTHAKPSVRYGKNTSGRRKFGGIGKGNNTKTK